MTRTHQDGSHVIGRFVEVLPQLFWQLNCHPRAKLNNFLWSSSRCSSLYHVCLFKGVTFLLQETRAGLTTTACLLLPGSRSAAAQQ
jgi:hypothetical protein